MPSANLPADMEKQTMEIEISARGEWIRKMNEILGYDNSDGFHSEPCPHDLAKEMRSIIQRAADGYMVRTSAAELISKLRTPSV